eukprot:5024349-Pleurochrysis_carterae.AAC.1
MLTCQDIDIAKALRLCGVFRWQTAIHKLLQPLVRLRATGIIAVHGCHSLYGLLRSGVAGHGEGSGDVHSAALSTVRRTALVSRK